MLVLWTRLLVQSHLFDIHNLMHPDMSFFWQHMRLFDVKNRFDDIGVDCD